MIIAEHPGPTEDTRGELNTGTASNLLRQVLRKEGIDLDYDCVKMNAIACYPGKDETPTDAQIDWCRPMVWNKIKEMKPRLIILLGSSAIKSFLGHRWTKKLDGISLWRGWSIPDKEVSCWVCPTYHPSYIQHMDKNPAVETIWVKDLRNAIAHLKKPLPKYTPEKECIRIYDEKELYGQLRKLVKSELSEIAIDFETTGLKPHNPEHAIVTCAIAESEDFCYAFNMPKEGKNLHLLKQVLENEAISKIAANLKFEHTWAEVKLGVTTRGWLHDTMLTAHLLDNRKFVTGLKFQAYVTFGVLPYDDHISPYLKGVDDGDGNSLNRIYEAPRRELLYYNALDSLYELRLAEVQRKKLIEQEMIAHAIRNKRR